MVRGTEKSNADLLRGMQKSFGRNFENMDPNDRTVALDIKARNDAHWAEVAAKKERNKAEKAQKAELKAGKKRATEDYESDDGFVANDGSDNDGGPKSKKAKKEVKAKGKASAAKPNAQTWEITNNRRVTIDLFKGSRMVNIREYYEKDGELLPGKKGISLPVAQFNTLLSVLPEIEAALVAEGETVERPVYGRKPVPATDGANDENDEKAGVKENKSTKKNFEETSEEDE